MDRILSFLVFLIAFVNISAVTKKGTDTVLFDGATADDEDEFDASGEEIPESAPSPDNSEVLLSVAEEDSVRENVSDTERNSQGFDCDLLALLNIQCPTEDPGNELPSKDLTSQSAKKPESPASVDETTVYHLTESTLTESTHERAASPHLSYTIVPTGVAAQLTMHNSAAVDSEVMHQTSRHASTIIDNADMSLKSSSNYVTSAGFKESVVSREQSTTPNVAVADETPHTSPGNAFDLSGGDTVRPFSTLNDFDTTQTTRKVLFDVDARAFPERTYIAATEGRRATTIASTASRLSSKVVTSGLMAAIITSRYNTEGSQEDESTVSSQQTTIPADLDERMATTAVAIHDDVNLATSASDGDASTDSDVNNSRAAATPAITGSFEGGNPMTSTRYPKSVSTSIVTTRGEEILFTRGSFPITIVIVCVIAALLALAIILVLAVIIRGRLSRSGKYDISSEVNSINGTESGSPNGAKVVTVQYNDTKA